MAENETRGRRDLTDDEQQLVDYLRLGFKEDPPTLRVMNMGSLVPALVCGATDVPDEDLPEVAVYDHWRAVCEGLVEIGVLQKGEVIGETAYALSHEEQNRA